MARSVAQRTTTSRNVILEKLYFATGQISHLRNLICWFPWEIKNEPQGNCRANIRDGLLFRFV